MTLGDLFKYVSQLNKINKALGADLQYGIRVTTLKSYDKLDCWDKVYIDAKEFVKQTEEESYFTNLLQSEVSLMEQTYNLESLEYESKFTGSNNLGDTFEQNVIIYITKYNRSVNDY